MTEPVEMMPEEIRAARADAPNIRERDLADKLNISEAELVAAFAGEGVTRVGAHPDTVIGAASRLREVMALTRNLSCVHEKVGVYKNYTPGAHAAMVLAQEIDLRIFPAHWVHAFMVERGERRSLQVFDAAGDAIHKVHLPEGSDLGAWERLKCELAVADQGRTVPVEPRQPVEAAKANAEKADILRKEWARLTDTHQFLRLTAKLRMNRLGAYRIAGAPFARKLAPEAVDAALKAVQARAVPVMVFVGNRGCIQIHSGPIRELKAMGPWQNVMDPGFNLHLRLDQIAEVWAVEKPTVRGPANSLEAFDARGALILQIFGIGKADADSRPAWREVLAGLEGAGEVVS